MRACVLTGVCLLLLGSEIVPAQAHDGGGVCAGNAAPVIAARASLDATPTALPARFRFADALIEAGCYDEAVHALEDGESLHPRNPDLAAKLRTTRSLVSEQSYFAGLEDAEVAARVSRNLLRCTRLNDLNACDEALKLKPNDVQVLIAKGDALLQSNKPADAEITYRRAKEAAPGDAKAATQLAAAQAQRQTALSQCQRGDGDVALAACQAALLRGASDEFTIHSRLAQLHQQRNQPGAALASYIAANALQGGDRGVALGIVAVTDADSRKDAVSLAARGSALLTLGRGREALAALKQAQTLAPSLPDLKAQIARAQTLAGKESAPASVGAVAGAPVPVASNVPTSPGRRYSNVAEPGRSH
ncbi:MAG: tetratricopeptide repeat protein [Steroidobacteraceae bacterium]|nr:tetratricopeptide repeat protein [Steroidobacteraceae bacterium]